MRAVGGDFIEFRKQHDPRHPWPHPGWPVGGFAYPQFPALRSLAPGVGWLFPMIVAQYRILPEPISSLASAVGIGGFFWGYFGAAFRGAVWYMRWLPALIAIAVFFASSRDRRFHERTDYRFFVLQPAVVWVGIEFIRGSMLRDGALTGRTIRWRTLEKPASPGEPIPPLVLRGANWAL